MERIVQPAVLPLEDSWGPALPLLRGLFLVPTPCHLKLVVWEVAVFLVDFSWGTVFSSLLLIWEQ